VKAHRTNLHTIREKIILKILIVIGSLRAASFSKKLAEAATQLGPAECDFEIIDGRDVPLYDQDLDGDDKPAAVARLMDRVVGADALCFITPEFNYGLPANLKNHHRLGFTPGV
jgi:chromate reductase